MNQPLNNASVASNIENKNTAENIEDNSNSKKAKKAKKRGFPPKRFLKNIQTKLQEYLK